MDFLSKLEDTIDRHYNVSTTENGALGYKTTKSNILDMNFKVPSYRRDKQSLLYDFRRAISEDKLLALKWMFYLRDIRGGIGERESFRFLLMDIGNLHPAIVEKLLPIVAEYGRYDDLWSLFGTKSEEFVLKFVKTQIISDLKALKEKKPISLLAKWLPSENASSERTKRHASKIRKYIGFSPKEYRCMLSAMRKALKIVERDASSNNWSEINYEAVPSRANIIYNNAFLRHDEDRRRNFLESLKKGEKKINAGTLFPHDIVHKYHGRYAATYDETLEQLWKNLPDTVKEESGTIVVADGSGSMTATIDSNSRVSAHEVADALAIYFAERCSGAFKNKYITFSSRPQLVDLNKATLLGKLQEARKHSECADTNIEATFDLILKTAISNHMEQSELPKNILIISDMEFNYACEAPVDERLFETIRRKYEENGYKLPKLIFWNVNSRTNTIPLTENSLGVALVSGYSVNIVNMVMNGELDPYKALVKVLNAERYKAVEDALKDVL